VVDRVALSLHYTQIEGREVKLEIWDTSGHPGYQHQLAPYYRSAKAALLVFNPSIRATFLHLQKAIQQIPSARSYLVLSHRIGWDDDVSTAEIDHFCRVAKVKWAEASAASGLNVQKAFIELCKEAL